MGLGIAFALGVALGWAACPRGALLAEIALLRLQIGTLRRSRRARVCIRPRERLLIGWLCRLWPHLMTAVAIVKPETVIRWHRESWRLFWRWKSRGKSGRPKADRALRDLIRRVANENPLWGAPRIHGELQKLGFSVAQSTVAKYLASAPDRGGQRWQTFLANHREVIAAIDMLTVPTFAFEQLFVFVVLGLGRRKILHVDVTDHPTALWLARQITEAFPWDSAPEFLIRDNDRAYGHVFRSRLCAMGIRDCPTAPHSPQQNGHAERVIGSIRRECLDHVIALNADHLRRVLREYIEYYNSDRTHLSLDKDSPDSRAVEAVGEITSRPALGGLHHRYGRKTDG